VFLQATRGELLPTFCKGLPTLFPTEKAGLMSERQIIILKKNREGNYFPLTDYD